MDEAAVAKTACVTGGNGYLASVLIKQLLAKGYTVNATVRNLDDKTKTSHLMELKGPGTLKLFRANLTEEGSFDEAVNGCDFVFHVAAPVNIRSSDPENELIKPAVQGILNVMKSCVKAKTVKRVVLTSSAAAVSVNRLIGTNFVLDEESWTDTEFLTTEKPPSWGYILSRTLAEKEAWKFARENNIDLVSIIPPLILGPSLTMEVPPSMRMGLALVTGNEIFIGTLKFMQALSGSISFVHVEDVCRAHIFVAETESAAGRYICCSINTSLVELAEFLSKRYSLYEVPTDFGDQPAKAKLSLSSEKLLNAGFNFKNRDLGKIYDEVIEYAKEAGLVPK